MTGTFLSRVEFGDFRTFGRFRLDLAPAPGLTLPVGTNGLGKSTFFDGIEWGLSGRIRRFTDHIGRHTEADYLTRRDAERPNSHSVALAFNDGAVFTRTGTSAPEEERLLATLKTPLWGPIRDLGAYLALTHFLGQAAQQRFTSRPKNDQWEALKGPSGIDRLEVVRTALRGAATTAAFRRRLAQEEAEVDLVEQELSRWRDDVGRLAELREAARASGALTTSAISNGLNAIESFCASLGMAVPAVDDGMEPITRVIVVREALERARTARTDNQRLIERLRSIADAYDALTPVSDPDGAIAAVGRQAIEEATAVFSQTSLASRTVERAVEAAAETVAHAEAAIERTATLAAMLAEIAEVAVVFERLTTRRASLSDQLVAAEAAKLASAGAVATGRQTQVTRRSLAERLISDERIVERAGRLAVLFEESRNADNWAERAKEASAAAAATEPGLQAEQQRLRRLLTDSEAELAIARRRASELADALATVAKHLDEHDERCPVCTTPFPAGVLTTLATAAANGQDAHLSEKAQRVETITRELEATEAGLAVAAESGMHAATAGILADNARAALLNARIEVARLLDVSPERDIASLAHERLSRTADEITELDATAALADFTVPELEAAAANDERTHAALANQIAQVEIEIAASERRIAELDDALPEEADGLDREALSVKLEQEREELREVQGNLAEARVALSTALAAEATARQRLDAASAARAHTETLIANARSDRRDLARQWAALGANGEPSHRDVAGRSDELLAETAAIDAALAETDTLARGLRENADRKELVALEERLAKTSSAETPVDPTTYEKELSSRLGERRAALRATTATQKAVNAYTVELKKRADRFSAAFLEPLNGLIDDFNRTLLSTPGETVQFSADAAVNRTDLGMRLRYADDVDNSRYDTGLAPQLVLSEGQLAANGFSILCAASVAYRWSNWRALLLDDPLQHNDIIHAAAFADVMRNLVEYQGYQLLMSSHDRAEGEFLFRKFDAAGLPCTMVTLTAPSRDGVLSEPPRHNSAATRLLAQPMTIAG